MTVKEFKTPSKDFESLIKILRFSASICGLDLLVPDYQLNWITYTLFIGVSGYHAFVFFTIWKLYADDWTIILKSTVTLGTALQGVSKLYAFISNKYVIKDLYLLLSGIYRDYEKLGDKYKKALETSCVKVRKWVYVLMPLYVIGYTGIVAVPFISLITKGERNLVLEFHIPGLDIETDLGYFCTMAFQTVLVIGCAFGLYCADIVALIYLLQSHMFSYVFAAKIEYINEMVKNSENIEKTKVTRAIKDIIEWHQLYSNYTYRCNALFYYVITVQIVTAFCSTVLSIYLVMDGAWPGAYTYVLVHLKNYNDKFEQDIYNIHWYKLTVSQQKLILQVLCKTQRPQIIDVAGVMPLSVSTALKITKTIYSIIMVMIKFFME